MDYIKEDFERTLRPLKTWIKVDEKRQKEKMSAYRKKETNQELETLREVLRLLKHEASLTLLVGVEDTKKGEHNANG